MLSSQFLPFIYQKCINQKTLSGSDSILSEEAVSDPVETRGNQDVRYQEFNEVTLSEAVARCLR